MITAGVTRSPSTRPITREKLSGITRETVVMKSSRLRNGFHGCVLWWIKGMCVDSAGPGEAISG